MLAAFRRQPGYLLDNTLVTLADIAAGFAAGAVLGTLTALGIAALPRLGRIVWPIVLVLQALPVFVIAPLLVIWLGFDLTSKVVMATIIIFFPVASAFGDGLLRIDQNLLDATALAGTGYWRTLIDIRVPLALPSLVSGLRVTAPLAPLGRLPSCKPFSSALCIEPVLVDPSKMAAAPFTRISLRPPRTQPPMTGTPASLSHTIHELLQLSDTH